MAKLLLTRTADSVVCIMPDDHQFSQAELDGFDVLVVSASPDAARAIFEATVPDAYRIARRALRRAKFEDPSNYEALRLQFTANWRQPKYLYRVSARSADLSSIAASGVVR